MVLTAQCQNPAHSQHVGRKVPVMVSRLTKIEMGSHGWLTDNAHLQDKSTTRMCTAQCNYNYYITTTRTQYQITIHYTYIFKIRFMVIQHSL